MKFSLLLLGFGVVMVGCSANQITRSNVKGESKLVNTISQGKQIKNEASSTTIVDGVEKTITVTQTSNGDNGLQNGVISSSATVQKQGENIQPITQNQIILETPALPNDIQILSPPEVVDLTVTQLPAVQTVDETVVQPIIDNINTGQNVEIVETVNTIDNGSSIQPISTTEPVITTTTSTITPQLGGKVNVYRVSAYQDAVFPRIPGSYNKILDNSYIIKPKNSWSSISSGSFIKGRPSYTIGCASSKCFSSKSKYDRCY